MSKGKDTPATLALREWEIAKALEERQEFLRALDAAGATPTQIALRLQKLLVSENPKDIKWAIETIMRARSLNAPPHAPASTQHHEHDHSGAVQLVPKLGLPAQPPVPEIEGRQQVFLSEADALGSPPGIPLPSKRPPPGGGE